MYAQGDLDDARSLHERALAIRETRLGPDHPETALSHYHLADVLRDQGDLDGAVSSTAARSPSARPGSAPTTRPPWQVEKRLQP
jgi:hypothetical protein